MVATIVIYQQHQPVFFVVNWKLNLEMKNYLRNGSFIYLGMSFRMRNVHPVSSYKLRIVDW